MIFAPLIKPKKAFVIHNAKCVNKSCVGGDQLAVKEYTFRDIDMVRLHCTPCKYYYSRSRSSLKIEPILSIS